MCIKQVKVSKSISISSLNVNGLFKNLNNQRICKMDDPNFSNFMKADIVCLSETHASKKDVLQYEGYKCYLNCRGKESQKLSGGLATFIKRNIVYGVRLIDKTMSDMLWFKLDKGFFKFSKDLYLCFVYISPKQSSYTVRTNCDKVIFEKLERDVSKFSQLGDIVLMGDINAHINKDEHDYIINDSDNMLDDFLPDNYISDSIQRQRNTEICQKTNEYGRNFVELCIDAQLRILNGRTIGDSMGRLTYHNYAGASIDDYCICNSSFLPNISSFKVGEFNPILTDHCPITVNIFSQYSDGFKPDTLQFNVKKIKWNNTKEALFRANLANFNYDKLCEDLGSLSKSVETRSDIQKSLINSKISEFSSFLIGATVKNAGKQNYQKRYKSQKRKRKKLWFDNECETKYSHVKNLARNLSKNPWDKNLRQKVAFNKKELNKLIRKKHRLFKNGLMKKILESENNNPSEFWKSVNQLKCKVQEDPSANISPNEWVDYFKKLINIKHVNKYKDMDEYLGNSKNSKTFNTEILNADISTEEVLKAVKELKYGKSSGPDGILNEMLKISCDVNTKVYVCFFNCILKQGVYPDLWKENFIKPIFKGGCFNNPSDYRGVALSSCFGKFFSKILSKRLDKFLEINNIICNEQIGFRRHCRTSDHILTLKCLINKAFKMSKRLYACFIDLRKAYDTVNREALLYKISSYNISGTFFNILQNMYDEVRYSVKFKEGATDMFPSEIGVKQGCILSPTLFSLYLNDMVNIFDSTCDPIQIENMKLSALMYADDIVLLSESAEGLQSCLNKLSNYCEIWNLSVNIEKSQVMIFNKSGKVFKKIRFIYDNSELEITDEYKYLGVLFKPSGSFTKANEYLCKKARKALFCIYKTLFSDKLNILPSVKLFDTCVKPILLYCSEILCLDTLLKENSTIESRHFLYPQTKIQIRFIKHILGVSKTASNYAVLGEVGMIPCSADALKLSVGFWYHINNSSSDSLSHKIYQSGSLNNSDWYREKLKLLFNKIGFQHVWNNQNSFSKNRLTHAVFKNIKNDFIKFWKDSISKNVEAETGNKLRTYKDLKKKFEMEEFLKVDLNRTDVINFVRIRISNSSLMIEKGRHRKIALDNRLCPLCSLEIEDELHFCINCPKLEQLRSKLFTQLSDIFPHFINLTDLEKFHLIFQSNDYDVNVCCIQAISEMYKLRNTLA